VRAKELLHFRVHHRRLLDVRLIVTARRYTGRLDQ
jgi:hypothetical protein